MTTDSQTVGAADVGTISIALGDIFQVSAITDFTNDGGGIVARYRPEHTYTVTPQNAGFVLSLIQAGQAEIVRRAGGATAISADPAGLGGNITTG